MKYNKIDSSLFIKNPKNFVKKLESNSIAFFNSNDIYPVSADSTLPFEQHRDIFYLSGIDQEESILVLFPDSKKNSFKEMLFIRETNDHITHWEGEKLTKEKAKDISGINNIYWTNEFENILIQIIKQSNNVYINTNEHYRQNVETQTREDRFIEKLKKISGYMFEWIENEDIHPYSGKDIGVIAQEINSIIPEITTLRNNGYLAVKYEKLVPILVKAIQELEARVATLEGE